MNPGQGARSDTADLASAVRSQSWSWLREIERRLDFSAEILDDQGAPCVMSPRSHHGALRLTGAAAAAFTAATHAVIRANQTQRLTIDGAPIVLCPLSVRREGVGVLVLSRPANHIVGEPAGNDRPLEDIGTWLSRAIQTQLQLPVDESDAFDRVASLHKLLQDVIERGVEHEVITAFAEALIAWDDIEVRGYVQDLHGQLTLAVATPGVDRQAAASLSASALPLGHHLTRLSPGEATRAGFRRDRDVFAACLGGGHAQPWCVVLSGHIRSEDEARLSLYVDLLRGAVARTATLAETRVSWAVLQQLLGGTGDPAATGQAALGALKAAIGAGHMGLQVSTTTGGRALAMGDLEVFADATPSMTPLVSMLTLTDGEVLTLRAWPHADTPFTAREQQLVDRTAGVFSAWLAGVRKRSTAPVERRAEHREFHTVVDRLVQQNLREGVDVAVVVLLVASGAPRPGLLHQWVADIRGRLRSGDTAGVLSEREVGIFLAGAAARDVARVSHRLRHHALKGAGGGDDHGDVVMGFAARHAGSTDDESLVKVAREDAVRRRESPEPATSPQRSA